MSVKMKKGTKKKSVLYSESTDDNQDPSKEDIKEQARRLGVDLEKEPKLLNLVKESITSQVPHPWKPCYDATKKAWYYYNTETYKSQWDHPADVIYKEKIKELREQIAMYRMQSLDLNVTKPPKSLPPLKKPSTAKLLNSDGMPQLKELKKLGPIPNSMASTADPLRAGLRALSLNPSALKPLGQTMMSSPMSMRPSESEMSDRKQLSSSLKDSSGYESVTQQNSKSNTEGLGPPRKLGLTLTGAGSSFMKRDPSKSETLGDSDLSDSDTKSQVVDATANAGTSPQESVIAGKPFKSILVKSNSSLRSQNQSDMKWNVDLDSLKDDEKRAWNKMESLEKRSSAVKFKLDENTELHFETSLNENEEDSSTESKETTADETENDESDEEKNDSEVDILPTKETKELSPIPSARSNQSSSTKSSVVSGQASSSTSASNTAQGERPSSINQQETLPKPVIPIPQSRLGSINPPNAEERFGKTLGETLKDLNEEREQAVKRAQEQLEKQKAEDLAKAKAEIENILKLEMDKIKVDFQVKIQTKKAELLQQYNKELNEAIETLKRQHEQQIGSMKSNHAAAMEKLRAQAESEFQLEKTSIREELRKSFEKEKDELRRQLIQQNESELNELKAELEVKKHNLEVELQNSIDDLEKEMRLKLKSAKSSATSLDEETINKNREIEELKFKSKYERLEAKYNALKKQIQLLVENQKLNQQPSSENLKKSSSIPSNLPQRILALADEDKKREHHRDDHDDSANESDSESSSTSSYSEDKHLENDTKEGNDGDHGGDSSSRESRLYSALKSLDDIRQQIIALTQEKQVEKSPSVSVEVQDKPTRFKKSYKNRNSFPYGENDFQVAQNVLQAGNNKQRIDFPSGDSIVKRPRPREIPSTPNKDLVEEAKDFIRTQRHRLGTKRVKETFVASPIATTLGVKQRLALEKTKAENSQGGGYPYPSRTKSIRPFLHGDHREMSETESSGVGSWKDLQSIQKRKVSDEIDQICRSLTALDGQMKEVWTMVKTGSGDNQGDNFPVRLSSFHDDETVNKRNPPISLSVRTLNLPERKNYHGAVDQMKKMWTSTLRSGDSTENLLHHSHGDSFHHPSGDSTSAFNNPNVLLPNSLHQGNYASGQNPLMSLNPTLLQPLHYDSALNSLIPGRGNSQMLVETLDEEIKHFKEKQAQLVNEFAPYKPSVDTAETLHERTKHLREWLDKF